MLKKGPACFVLSDRPSWGIALEAKYPGWAGADFGTLLLSTPATGARESNFFEHVAKTTSCPRLVGLKAEKEGGRFSRMGHPSWLKAFSSKTCEEFGLPQVLRMDEVAGAVAAVRGLRSQP